MAWGSSVSPEARGFSERPDVVRRGPENPHRARGLPAKDHMATPIHTLPKTPREPFRGFRPIKEWRGNDRRFSAPGQDGI